jgi:serralysin
VLSFRTGMLSAFLSLAGVQTAHACAHQWRFNELFTNSSGSVQFIEMQECCGFTAEWFTGSKWILARHVNHKFTFSHNMSGNTSHRYLLLGTQTFANIPGAPAPDFIIPDGFLPVGGDTLEWWMYPNATRRYTALPHDGMTALLVGPGPDGISGTADDVNETAVNSPTNFAGQSGSISVSGVPAEPTTWGRIKSRALARH